MYKLVNSCPSCKNKVRKEVYRFWDAGQLFKIYECGNCGLNFLDRQLELRATAELEKFAKGAAQGLEVDLEIVKREGLVQFISRYRKPPAKTLEMGCGAGFLLKSLENEGYDVVGLELSRDYAKYAKEKLELPVVMGISCDVFRHASFELVLLFHVLEHLNDPDMHLRRIHDVLEQNGMLIVQVPRFDQYEYCLKHIPGFFNRAHNFYFTSYTFIKAFLRNGFKIYDVLFDHVNSFITVVAVK